MTLIPSKWKRTVLFCNFKVCQHVFPRKKVSQSSDLHNELHPFQKMSFQNDLESPSFHFWNTFSKRGTQPRNKIKVHNWDHKSSYTVKTQDIQKQQKIWIICENIKYFQYTFVGLLQTLKIIPNEKHFSLSHKKSTNILNYHTKGSQPYNFTPPNKSSLTPHFELRSNLILCDGGT